MRKLGELLGSSGLGIPVRNATVLGLTEVTLTIVVKANCDLCCWEVANCLHDEYQ
jgi:hypothetical protein